MTIRDMAVLAACRKIELHEACRRGDISTERQHNELIGLYHSILLHYDSEALAERVWTDSSKLLLHYMLHKSDIPQSAVRRARKELEKINDYEISGPLTCKKWLWEEN